MGSLHFRFEEVLTSRLGKSEIIIWRGDRLLRNRFGGKPLDIDPGRMALPLLHTLDQTNAGYGVKLGKKPYPFVVPTVKGSLNLVQGVVDIDPAAVVIPMVLDGQTHAVKHKAVKQLCICGQIFELLSGHKQPGDAVIGKLLRFAAVEIIEADRRLQYSHLLSG